MAAIAENPKLDQLYFWNELPNEIRHEIISFLADASNSNTLDTSIQTLARCRLVNKDFNFICSEELKPLKSLYFKIQSDSQLKAMSLREGADRPRILFAKNLISH